MMIRVQYFVNFVGDVSVIMPDIKKIAQDPPTFEFVRVVDEGTGTINYLN